MVRMFFAPSRLQNRSPQACKAAKRAANAPSARVFPIRPKQSKKATIPPLFRPWFPFSPQPYHAVKSYSCIHTYQYINLITNILTTNNHSCSTSQNHKSQITINKKSIVEKVKKEEVSLYIYLYLILYILYII
ncbi:hypothetical protein, partial [uncultured Bacteroides sp.]|uniref:hypothetical protein n=1 Tax=uncultured Bacteroides sp. TaxID=162156 RepID=UPI00261DB1DD